MWTGTSATKILWTRFRMKCMCKGVSSVLCRSGMQHASEGSLWVTKAWWSGWLKVMRQYCRILRQNLVKWLRTGGIKSAASKDLIHAQQKQVIKEKHQTWKPGQQVCDLGALEFKDCDSNMSGFEEDYRNCITLILPKRMIAILFIMRLQSVSAGNSQQVFANISWDGQLSEKCGHDSQMFCEFEVNSSSNVLDFLFDPSPSTLKDIRCGTARFTICRHYLKFHNETPALPYEFTTER